MLLDSKAGMERANYKLDAGWGPSPNVQADALPADLLYASLLILSTWSVNYSYVVMSKFRFF